MRGEGGIASLAEMEPQTLSVASILDWLHETDTIRLERLYGMADAVRRRNVGDAVHLRGLVEISSYCARQCGYCGLRAGNNGLSRYRLNKQEILAAVRQAVTLGFGTVVLQGGEDYGIGRGWMAEVVRQIKSETPLAVTLSLGERPEEDLAAWREAGADRYLLRFETSDPELYRLIHPDLGGQVSDRVALLRLLRRMGYEIGSGIMVGLPGQSLGSVARDIALFRELDLDMVGIGPYIAHSATPLGTGQWRRVVQDQASNSEELVYKVIALTRLSCPQANIPATTALATINQKNGREMGLQRGANVVMPNLTPPAYRALYEIYPSKACVNETATQCNGCLRRRIESIGRFVGSGAGGRHRR